MTYLELLGPSIRRFEVAAAMGLNATWNPTGSAAMAKLLKETAMMFDHHVAAQNAKDDKEGGADV